MRFRETTDDHDIAAPGLASKRSISPGMTREAPHGRQWSFTPPPRHEQPFLDINGQSTGVVYSASREISQETIRGGRPRPSRHSSQQRTLFSWKDKAVIITGGGAGDPIPAQSKEQFVEMMYAELGGRR
jgi:hypothetical protein